MTVKRKIRTRHVTTFSLVLTHNRSLII